MDKRQVHGYPHPAQTRKLRLGARGAATSTQGTGSEAEARPSACSPCGAETGEQLSRGEATRDFT